MTEKDLREVLDTLEVEVDEDEEGHPSWVISSESFERVVDTIMELTRGE